jgi:hypothetical protein
MLVQKDVEAIELTSKPRPIFLCILILILVLATEPVVPVSPSQNPSSSDPYAELGLEATNWITSFQVTPLNDSWGIPYKDQRAWGLDPYFFDNGTITAGVGNITGGARQELAYLIGGHDAGEGAYAALSAYLETRDPKYLDIFKIYYSYFESAQIPGTRTITPAKKLVFVGGKNVTIDNSGFWAEQASVSAGDNGTYGSANDTTTVEAIYPAAEHGNPIAIALIVYYRLTRDPFTLSMLNRYGSWLVRTQIHTGEYAGAFPVTQYYYALGWKPRMFETTESAWVLAELYLITGNQTYLNSAEAAGQYMLSKQFVGTQWLHTLVYGALPYEWNETHYTNSVSTNHAGFTILAWSQLFQITGDKRYLDAATTYANWLLSFQVTKPDTLWGNHTYANDSMAVGGFYYGYHTEKHEFGADVDESLWSAAYAIPALLVLSQITGDVTYRDSASLAAEWLVKMRYPDQNPVPLQALAIVKYPVSSWWGLYPQYYQPDMSEIAKAGIESFVNQGVINESSIKDKHPTWFERTFSVDFNVIDYEMANRGPTYMKMIWSWWPNIGFEPRYGGDIAFGAFATDGYMTFNATFRRTLLTLAEIDSLTGNNTSSLPENTTATYNEASAFAKAASEDFRLGWYTLAKAQALDAAVRAETVLNYIQLTMPLRQANQILVVIATFTLGAFALSNLYWHKRLARSKTAIEHGRTRRKQRRKSHD